MNVIKFATTSKVTGNASVATAGNYTLNKYIYPGTTTCCTGQTGGPGLGTGQNYSDPGPAQLPVNYGKPAKPAPRGRKSIRKTSPRE
jgi:hypothetical protein